MKIKLDENISRQLKSILNKKGHEAVTAEDQGSLGKSDVEMGDAAKIEGRMNSLLFSESLPCVRVRPVSILKI